MSQSEKPFRFKEFEVHHGRSAMRVGTDAVLLASWANMMDAKHVLDVGTGTGVIALMCAQRALEAMVEGIEIHDGSAEDARLNFANSPWKTRLRLHVGDFLKIVSGEKFDRIISNPPYFSQSLRASDPDRSAARHDDYLPADAFLRQCKKLLSENGIVSLILPASQLERWIVEAMKVGLSPKRICHVFTLAHKDPARVMLELSFDSESEPEMESILIQKSLGEFSEAYKNLTKAFYIKF
jgi:tRNA1Val (adenine37-N6)-methyltransferase